MARRRRAPCGLEVDDQFEFGRLHDRQVRRSCAFENSARIAADLLQGLRKVGPVAHEPAGNVQVLLGVAHVVAAFRVGLNGKDAEVLCGCVTA